MRNAKLLPEMTRRIFDLKHARPFRPFQMRTAGGDVYTIARVDAVGRSPSGRTVMFYDRDQPGHQMLDVSQIVAVVPVRPGARSSGRRRPK